MRLATAWSDDDWEDDDSVTIPIPTAPPRKKRKKVESPIRGPMPCQYFTASFPTTNSEYVVIECLGPEIPSSAVYKVSPEFSKNPLQLLTYLQNNTVLKVSADFFVFYLSPDSLACLLQEEIARIALPQIKSFPVMISGGYHAQVRMFLPPGLREDEITRYPMIVHV